MYDVVGIDQPCVDLSVNLAHFPKPDGREPILNYSFQGGGKAATGLAAASLMGANCAIAGNVGDDRLADFCRRDLEYHGVDTRYLISRKGKYTSFSVVISELENKTRSILPHRSNGSRLGAVEIPDELLRNTRFLLVPIVNKGTLYAAAAVRRYGGKVVMDADESVEYLEEILPFTDAFVASETLYNQWFHGSEDYEGNCRSVQKKGPETVIFTMGGKGCFGVGKEGFFSLEAFPIKVVDTLGAGDTFHGAFTAGLAKGMAAYDAARLAGAAAAIKCTRIGGRAGIPDYDTVLRYLKEGYIDDTAIEKMAGFYREGFENV